MDKVVSKGVKIDLHIHSEKSKFKDDDLVASNTIDNLPKLIKKLNDYEVNVCSISDHDSFDYELYKKLKSEEGNGFIQKVFPAVEFTVNFNNRPKDTVHVVCVFNDNNEDKIHKIGNVLLFDKITNRPFYDLKDAFSENKFIELLSLIDLDVVCIAHQKKTLTTVGKPAKNDANSVGEDRFNEFLFSEYFEAFEFKNRKNQAFNNYSKSKLNDDLLRFITGSDCHDWISYPKYSPLSSDNDFKHTFLKCLPNFRGLALALTDDTRISLDDNFFSGSNYQLDSIKLSVDGITTDVPLSKGINAIIGDNSIGKSLLLHKMTDYYRIDDLSPLNLTVKKGYESYLSDNNIDVLTKLDEKNVFLFDTQGEIRKKFNQGKLTKTSFFKDKYPPDIDTTLIKSIIIEEINKVGNYFKSLFEYNQSYKDLSNICLLAERDVATSVSLIDCGKDEHTRKHTQLSSTLLQLNKAKTELNNLSQYLNEEERNEMSIFIKYLLSIESKYKLLKDDTANKLVLINCINTMFNDFKSEKTKQKTTADANLEDYIQKENVFSDTMVELIDLKKSIKMIKPSLIDVFIKDESWDYLNYLFIKRTKVQQFDDLYLKALLLSPFDKKKRISLDTITEVSVFKDALKEYDDSDPVIFYKTKVVEQLEKDLSQFTVVNKVDEKGTSTVYSAGLNSQIYFEILSSDRYKKGIYLIDQPEDDVSPKSIKIHLLNNFKDMSRNRQILLVTHNPQFVVNLDVDNVIILTKEDDYIKIKSGALEYQDSTTDILNQVATLLDGGIETIRKRWKRYEKNN